MKGDSESDKTRDNSHDFSEDTGDPFITNESKGLFHDMSFDTFLPANV